MHSKFILPLSVTDRFKAEPAFLLGLIVQIRSPREFKPPLLIIKPVTYLF
jgi:hypothetical protein